MKRFIKNLPILPIPYLLLALTALSLVFYRWFVSLGNLGTVLGMRGTGDWSTSERPTNFREEILLQYPNSPVSLTAMMSKLKSENTDDPKITIFTKTPPSQH